MTNRERVIAAIEFAPKDFTPYDVNFTSQFSKIFAKYEVDHGLKATTNHHITAAYLDAPQTQISGKPEYYQDNFGVIWNRTGVDKDIGVIDNIQISNEEDLNRFQFPPIEETRIRHEIEHILTKKDQNFKVAALGFSLFERAWTLMGMENLLCNMVEEPELVHALLQKICTFNLQVLDIALEYPIDGFYFGDDWGQQKGLIMGPACWRKFIKPYLTKMYAKIKTSGKYVIQHSCGDIREIMEDLINIGLNVYQTFQPEIYGLGYSDFLYGKLTIWGGISVQTDLPYKTADEIREITKNTLQAFSRGGLIAAPTHAVPSDVPPENILAMVEIFENQRSS